MKANDEAGQPTGTAKKRWLVSIGGRCLSVISAPLRGYLELRRSVTFASVTVLLCAFVSLNVIWGFPWSGMMGACIAILCVGFVINRLSSPRLNVSVALPRSAVAAVPFSVNVRLSNPSFFPAVDLRVGWHREGIQDIRRSSESVFWDASPAVGVGVLRSNAVMHWHGSMQYFQRGVHELPPFYVSTLFPFHLFRNQKPLATGAKIAITPQPAHPDDDSATRMILSSIGEWAGQLVAGAPVEYVGNREYQVGIPVRRWDFASWARLGRPIVREYQSPSIQAATLIVDTSLPVTGQAKNRAAAKRERQEAGASLERLMSIAATAITELSSRRVKLELVLTSESDADLANHRAAAIGEQAEELMMVRLAAAGQADPQQAQQRITEAVSAVRSQQALILSLFKLDSPERRELASELPSSATYIAIDDQTIDQTNTLTKDSATSMHRPTSSREVPA